MYSVGLKRATTHPIIKKNSIFVIEASSYQLEYSKLFKSKYAVILNISSDHLERHKTIENYISAKFKLIEFPSAMYASIFPVLISP